MSEQVWFWQQIVSPHMAGLAVALEDLGLDVVYVAASAMSVRRAEQGWSAPNLGRVKLITASDASAMERQVEGAPADSVHICEGLRGNGLVGLARSAITRRRFRQWVVMETVQEHGWLAKRMKRIEYRRLLHFQRRSLAGILATGHATPQWLAQRGMPAKRIYPFAYFLADQLTAGVSASGNSSAFRFTFAGNFVELKRVDLLMRALAGLDDIPFELELIGSGPMEADLRGLAENVLPGRVRWRGRLKQTDVPQALSEADCLVLPSRHDGWGAVVSEALMVGTPAICSDRCGVADVVRRSGQGGVFASGDVAALTNELRAAITHGRVTPQRRAALADWARCLAASAGAKYLAAILGTQDGGPRPLPPWEMVRGPSSSQND